ncbi:enoyl-CoA hydratase [Rhodocyclus tenuis]|uniref:Enoyl-CoA hydratase n=2 Tax=Rhodocyclus TaxID=1064 RepID=A0A6L5K0L4_RHOTE|nr:enoyl-CoA hydratase-related protein [Rhodocyclus gracilis]MQY52380.1 enoyl-CoA hydratase [Rhodocyclus gracilis]NJA90214.1 enoyl-CoA hydratase [Rhodocyclus gracilis]
MSEVLYESRNGVAEITIDRADKYNVLTHEVIAELRLAWERFNASADDRVAILKATGSKAFTAGANLRDIPHDLWRAIPGAGIAVDKPVIAVTAGLVVGGGLVLVQFADLAIAADNSVFSYPEAKVGFSGGLISSLAARIPHKVAMELLLVGGSIDARRAYEVGLVNRVVPVGEELETARALAAQIAINAPLVLRLLKRFVGETLPKGPTEAAAHARAAIETINTSADFAEGIAAFVDKRLPLFSGR